MLNLRFFQPLLFSLVLLFAQQGGALHALRHVFAEQTQQQKKQTPHSPYCAECTTYAQLGGALNSGYLSVELHSPSIRAVAQHHAAFFTQPTIPAIARGPPLTLQSSS